jgi:hypothetical protein
MWLPSKGITRGSIVQTPGAKKSPLPPGEGQGEGASYRNYLLMIKKVQKRIGDNFWALIKIRGISGCPPLHTHPKKQEKDIRYVEQKNDSVVRK